MIINSLTTVRDEGAQIGSRNIFFGWRDNDHESIGRKRYECLAAVRVAFDRIESVREHRRKTTPYDADRHLSAFCLDRAFIVETLEAGGIHRDQPVGRFFYDIAVTSKTLSG